MGSTVTMHRLQIVFQSSLDTTSDNEFHKKATQYTHMENFQLRAWEQDSINSITGYSSRLQGAEQKQGLLCVKAAAPTYR